MYPLLLLHAFPLNSSLWDPQVEALGERVDVIALDLPGFGPVPPSEDDIFTMQRGAAFVLDVLNARGIERCVLGGISMGGYIAFECWRSFGHRIAGLLLADTKAAADTEEVRRGRMIAIERIRGGDYEGYLESMLERLLAKGTLASRPDIVERIRAMERTTPEAGTIAALKGMAERNDSTALLPHITVPAAVVAGEHDAVVTVEEAHSMAAAMPHATLHVIPDAGHLPNVENPEAFNEVVLDLLARVRERAE